MDLSEFNIEETNFADALSERYLAYALSTIMSRSLPDVRDGLKPVHRRLLYAMRQLRLSPQEAFKKSARVVGDVMGKFHPHGDAAIYDAMVRLAQDFSQRYPLVDGQGNFGNIDGDNAAAMRYTEARMTTVAERLLEGIDEETVDFRETYDGEGKEPLVLPAAFPNLLANGAHGIAVGMATSIPPHNICEICEALLHLIKHPNASFEKLHEYIPGPDFPTGGWLVENKENIIEAYKTGRGSFRIRADWEKEELKNGTYQIIIKEIPFQVQKSKLVEKLAELLESKKLNILNDVRDESAEDLRLVLEPKSRNIDPKILMETLFKQCDLEVKVNLNLNVLDKDQIPGVMSLRETLRAFLDHRHEVLIRRTHFRLDKITDRLDVLQGYLTAFLNLDKVIKIIREEDHPKEKLIKYFELSDRQAEAILNMRLRALRKLEEIQL
ncbi:MAG: DNA topoisomerase IV subunit A, partial [Rhodospirillaceae bacterium]|nr:DNA topoisomerase IV subunit A [Rhodospirillaceae bacterium]